MNANSLSPQLPLVLPPWAIEALHSLMQFAEELFGSKTGAQKKAWVKAAMLNLLAKIDIPGLPAALEEPLKEQVVEVTIETLWGLLFAGEDVRGPVLRRRVAAVDLPVALRLPRGARFGEV